MILSDSMKSKKAFLFLAGLLLVLIVFGMPARAATRSIQYRKENGSTAAATAQILTEDSPSELSEGWYAVTRSFPFQKRMTVTGQNVHLILCDNAVLTVYGITIPKGNKLLIYGQSDSAGSNVGMLISAPMEGSGIGGPDSGAGGDLVINGGSIRATGGEGSAGIGGGRKGSMDSITINGGRVVAEGWFPERSDSVYTGLDTHYVGSNDGGSGIGAGYKGACPYINLNGGNITAVGHHGNAGIGGSEAYGGNGIVINGGTVNATGGSGAAGIGGGKGTGSGRIFITDGNITATGLHSGAGIGGGSEGDCYYVEIRGGTVRAYAKENKEVNTIVEPYFGGQAAGIGGGASGNCGSITISGGLIRAIGGQGAGIGSGRGGDVAQGASILVTGGDVTASSVLGGAGIGGGESGNMGGTFRITGGTVRAFGSGEGKPGLFTSSETAGAAGIGGGQEYGSHSGGEGGTFQFEGGKVIACAGRMYSTAIGSGYNDSTKGKVTLASNARVRYTDDLSQFSEEEQAADTPRTPGSALEIADAADRSYACSNHTYVVVEICNHLSAEGEPDSNARYLDENSSRHYVTGTCRFCGVGTNQYEPHVFDEATHKCICGHQQVAVTFYDDDGNVLQPTQYVSAPGRIPAFPQDPVKERHQFEGWFEKGTDGSLTGSAIRDFTLVGHEMDLYPKWKETDDTVTVSFDSDGGSEILPKTIQKGTIVEKPTDPKKEGAVFAGWYLVTGNTPDGSTDETAFDFATPVTESITLKARWNRQTFKVSYHIDESRIIEKEVSYGAHAEDLFASDPTSMPVHEGQKFAGWYQKDTDGNYLPDPFNFSAEGVKKDLSLYAVWKPAEYTVSFDARGGSFVDDDNAKLARQTILHGEFALRPVLEETADWKFNGWDLNGANYDFTTPVTSDLVLTANWTIYCVVTFDAGPGIQIPPERIESGSLVEKPQNLTREDSELIGWYVDGDQNHLWNFEKDRISEDLTLKALWKSKSALTVSLADWTYGDSPAQPSVSGAGEESVSLTYKAADDADEEAYRSAIPALPGTYTVKASVQETSGHAAGEATDTFTISPRPVTVTAADQTIKQNGSIQEGPDHMTADGLAGGHRITDAVLNADRTDAVTESGRITPVSVKIADEAGKDVTENYSISYVAGTLTVVAEDNPPASDDPASKPEDTASDEPAPQPDQSGATPDSGSEQAEPATESPAQEGDATGAETDAAGSSFAPLLLWEKAASARQIALTWNPVEGATAYEVYGSLCNTNGRAYRPELLERTGSHSCLQENLKPGRYYKYYVTALNGSRVIAKSRLVHVVTKGGKYKNPTGVRLKKKTLKLRVGKKASLKAKTVIHGRMKTHIGLRYESSDPTIASVSKKGRVRAQREGTCYIYVIAQNGRYKRVKITVR